MQKLKEMNKNIIASVIVIAVGLFFLIFEAMPKSENRDNLLESRLEEFISDIDGAGEVKVMVNTDTEGEVSGIAVLCTGGSNIEIKSNIINTVSAVCAIPSNRIYVTLLKEEINE